MLIYLLLTAGIIFAVLRLIKVIKTDSADWLVVGLFLVAGVLYFMMPNFVVYGESFKETINTVLKLGAIKINLIGSIIGGISSIFTAVAVVASKKRED